MNPRPFIVWICALCSCSWSTYPDDFPRGWARLPHGRVLCKRCRSKNKPKAQESRA